MPLEIPGTSIRPPDKDGPKQIVCKNCHRSLSTLKKITIPQTNGANKVKYVCPFCGNVIL